LLQATFRPVDNWPGRARSSHQRRRSPFKGSWANTLDTLEREIGHLKGKSIVVQGYFDPKDIRNDGWPRSSARPRQPGVVVSFHTDKGPMSFPCDTYLDWEDNLRAIALALSALRAVDRYGVTQHAEQYKGFAQLPPPGSNGADHRFSNVNDAASFIAELANCQASYVTLSENTFLTAYRSAARRAHPDAGGSHESFTLLGQAKDYIARAYGW
jgi:hypothetical protein